MEQIEEWKADPPSRPKVQGELADDNEQWLVRIKELPEFPPDWGPTIGDAIHNYRSALDVLIFELAFIDQGGREVSGTGFPLVLPDHWNDPGIQAQIKHLTDTHRAMVHECQPTAEDGPHPLVLLTQLANDDKHRTIQPVFVVPQRLDWKVPAKGHNCEVIGFLPHEMVTGVLYPEAIVLRFLVRVTGLDPYVAMEGGFLYDIGYRNSTIVTSVLQAIDNEVSRLIEIFEPEFETPAALKVREIERRGRFHPRDPSEDEWTFTLEIEPNE